MDKFSRRPMFVFGSVLGVCGLGIGINDLLRMSHVSGIASGLLILGVAFVLIAWMQAHK